MGYFIAGFEILSEPCKNTMRRLIGKDEKVLFCVSSRQARPNLLQRDRIFQSIHGYHNWMDGLVFLEQRLIFFHGPKYGFVIPEDMGQPTLRYDSIDYKDVTSIATDTRPGANISFTVNEVSMIMPRESEKELRELESWLRSTVHQKRQQAIDKPEAAAGESADLIQQLEKLAELHRSGSLTDDEFAAGKRKLLEG
ncbi:MAG: SHOCT domain-containing protein [Bacteroidota bacterium]